MFSSSNNTEDEAFDSSGPSLEIDSDERDSAFGDTDSTLTMSVTESVYDYKYENGRRYHAYSEGKYPVPNDEVEKDRLDLQHHAFRLTLDGALYRAPIPQDVQNVLDVGTGTGIWAIEFAEEHPSAQVLGTDLSPIQPTEVPPNCSFLVDDCDKDWVFRDQFDFIHTRAMVAAIKDWDRFLGQGYANLKPGGYLELQEITFPALCTDSSMTPETSPLLRWSALFTEAADMIGLDASGPLKLGPKLRSAGFVDIHAKQYKWPVGRWAKGDKMKLLGRFVMEDLMDWLPSSAMGLFTRVLKWSREEVELFLSTVRRELKEEKSRHFYANVIVWYAQKPQATGSVNFDQDVVKEEEQLESDEERSVRSRNTNTDATTGAQQVQSPGALADTAAGLSLTSPPPEGPRESVLSTKPQVKPPSFIDAFKDSVLSLAAEATAHIATADTSREPETESELGPKGEARQVGTSNICDTSPEPGVIRECGSNCPSTAMPVTSEPTPVAQVELVKTEESLSATEGPNSSGFVVSQGDSISALRSTIAMPITIPEPEMKPTPASLSSRAAESMLQTPPVPVPVLKHDFGSALGPTSLRLEVAPAPIAPTPTSSAQDAGKGKVQVQPEPSLELEVDDTMDSDVDADEQLAKILGRKHT